MLGFVALNPTYMETTWDGTGQMESGQHKLMNHDETVKICGTAGRILKEELIFSR